MNFKYPIAVTDSFRYSLEKKGFAGYDEIEIYRKLYEFSKNPDQGGFNFEKLKNHKNRFTIRLNKGDRIFGAKILNQNDEEIFVFYKAAPHDYYRRLKNESGSVNAEGLTELDFEALEEFDSLEAVKEPTPERRIFNLEPWFRRYSEATKLEMLDEYEWDTLMNLTPLQKMLVGEGWAGYRKVKEMSPLLVQGGAGTGKSTTALHRILAVQQMCKELYNLKPEIFLVSYDSFLVRVLGAFLKALNYMQTDLKKDTDISKLPERQSVAQVEISTTMEFWRMLAIRWGLITVNEENDKEEKEKKEENDKEEKEKKEENNKQSGCGKNKAENIRKDYERGNLQENLKSIIRKSHYLSINTDLRYLARIFFSLKLLVERGADRRARILSREKMKERFDQWVNEGKIALKDNPDRIFGFYEYYLECGKNDSQLPRDEADLVRDLYEYLLDYEPADLREMVLIVDEAQDLAELELVLFFELLKKSFAGWRHYENLPFSPFMLLGDANQQIRSTGFDWIKFLENLFLDTNLGWNKENIFELNQNVRNTRQIARADRFLFDVLDKQYQCEYPLEPVEDGPTPFLFVFSDEEEMGAELEMLLNQKLSPCVTVLYESETLRERLKPLEDEGRFLAFNLAESKGMEFEDLILVGLFSSPEACVTKLNQIPADMRNLWHVGLSRARTNLLVCITRRELGFIQKVLFPERHQEFLDCFNIAANPGERRAAFDRFKALCQPRLVGISKIFRSVLSTEAHWKRFLREKSRQDRLEVFASARNNKQEAATIVQWYEDYREKRTADPEMYYEMAWMYDYLSERSKFDRITQTGQSAPFFGKKEMVYFYDEVLNFEIDMEKSPAIGSMIKAEIEKWKISEIRDALDKVKNQSLQYWLVKKLVDHHTSKAKKILIELED